MTKEQEKTIIFKTYSKINKMEDMAYVHKFCKDDDISYVDTDIVHINNSNIVDILKDIKNPIKENNIKKWKFRELERYFHETIKSPLILTFSEIEKIIGFNLCDSAYKYTSYWYKTAQSNISNAWSNQNYEILKLDLSKQKITFRKTTTKSSKLVIPQVLLTNKIPDSAKYELEEFFDYITKNMD